MQAHLCNNERLHMDIRISDAGLSAAMVFGAASVFGGILFGFLPGRSHWLTLFLKVATVAATIAACSILGAQWCRWQTLKQEQESLLGSGTIFGKGTILSQRPREDGMEYLVRYSMGMENRVTVPDFHWPFRDALLEGTTIGLLAGLLAVSTPIAARRAVMALKSRGGRKRRWLIRVSSSALLALCIAGWATSYSSRKSITCVHPRAGVSLTWSQGLLCFDGETPCWWSPSGWDFDRSPEPIIAPTFDFNFHLGDRWHIAINAPFWLPAVLLASVAAWSWCKPGPSKRPRSLNAFPVEMLENSKDALPEKSHCGDPK